MIVLADCAVTVSDTKKATRWWVEKLGFAVHTVGGSEHSVMVAPPGDKFVLHLCAGFEPAEPGNTGVAFMTDDIEALVARMEAAGVEFPEPLRKEAWGSIAKFADPDGNIFWLLGAPTSFVRTEARRRAPARTPAARASPRRRAGSRASRRAR
ncbi:MAG TPA: VOC family protein [Thermoplasmata archaeon]|jgi:catechol 2,3-dioxygenase-like lactoylglutathione lyase family enzyme|nr:VOC family protein [Thermoplasmata archaeon]HYB78699.1 VOC family protein [Thermoplasmata archaeon]